MNIVTREEKGSALSMVEADNNTKEFDRRTSAGWRDNIVQMVPRGGPTEPPFMLFRNGIYLPAFSHIDQMEAFASFHIDHDYMMGSSLYPHIHWSASSTETGNVRWGFEYTIAKGHQQMSFEATQTIYVDQFADGTPYKHYIAEVSDANAISGANIEPDTIILCRVFRDSMSAADTFGDHAYGICLDLHYRADHATTPNKAPNFFGV